MSFKKSYQRGVRVGFTTAEMLDQGEKVSELSYSDEYSDRAHRGELSDKPDFFLEEHFLMEGYKFGKDLYNQSKSKFRSVYDNIYD